MALIVVLTNKSNLAPVSDYTYQVLIGDGTIAHSKVIAAGRVTKHQRSDGWQALVQRVLDAHVLEQK